MAKNNRLTPFEIAEIAFDMDVFLNLYTDKSTGYDEAVMGARNSLKEEKSYAEKE